MSRARHRRLQKTRKVYRQYIRRISAWPWPLSDAFWAVVHAWRGHGMLAIDPMEFAFSIPPEETPFGKMVISGFEPKQWMGRKLEPDETTRIYES